MTLKESGYSNAGVPLRKYLFLLPLFILAAFFIYFPVLNRFFVSDDFEVLFRVCDQRVFFIHGFFRPLSDLTIFANYLVGGLNPVWYNSFNVLVHGINSFLLFLFSFRIAGSIQNKNNAVYFALLSSIFFICYPFHNEAIVWMLGRGAGMACLFTLSGFLCYYEIKRTVPKITTCCLCYFISMTAFESAILFPLIILLLLFFENQSLETNRQWTFACCFTFCIHLICRFLLSGSILGSYGNGFFHTGMKLYLLNIAKTAGRLILPPSNNALLLTSVFIFLIILFAIYFFIHIKEISQNKYWRSIKFLSGMLFISSIIPIIAGVSTQTSESDRLLYLPSVFVCMIWALIIIFLVRQQSLQRMLIFATIIYFLFFLELNNFNWKKASSFTSTALQTMENAKSVHDTSALYFVNIPNEIEGAYVFRMGFNDALKLYGLDSTRFIAVNYVSRIEMANSTEERKTNTEKTEISLPPDIEIKKSGFERYTIIKQGQPAYISRPGDEIYICSTGRLELLQPF